MTLDPMLPLDELFEEQLLLEEAEIGIVVPPQGGYVAKQDACLADKNNDPFVDPALKDAFPAAVIDRMAQGNAFEAASPYPPPRSRDRTAISG